MKVQVKKHPTPAHRKALKIEAIEAGKVIGWIVVKEETGFSGGRKQVPNWKVQGIKVDPKWQRKGIGTKLYETAAKTVEKRHGKALCSDRALTPEAKGFWEKQVRKGRAVGRSGCYCLKLPTPRSLGTH